MGGILEGPCGGDSVLRSWSPSPPSRIRGLLQHCVSVLTATSAVVGTSGEAPCGFGIGLQSLTASAALISTNAIVRAGGSLCSKGFLPHNNVFSSTCFSGSRRLCLELPPRTIDDPSVRTLSSSNSTTCGLSEGCCCSGIVEFLCTSGLEADPLLSPSLSSTFCVTKTSAFLVGHAALFLAGKVNVM